MPLVFDTHDAPPESCTLPECIEALAELGFDPRDPERTAIAADWLRKLNANRTFLADILIDRLSGRKAHEIDSGYGPQAIILSPVRGSFFLRANIWPAAHDLSFKNSGAQSFVYGIPHDHNFSFLTSGYLGPGYRSDYYEYEYGDVTGYPGESAQLRFVERSALHEGKLMLYRAHRDVHAQLPPESLSVSLNVMHVDPSQCWFDQYGFDLEKFEITRVINANATEAFLRVAVGLGSAEALDYAEWVGRAHPSDRLRLASYEARAALETDPVKRDAIWREGEGSGSRMVEAVANKQRAEIAL